MLKKPVFTEKAFAQTALDTYTFRVDRQATKTQIKQAVKDLYAVDVKSVRTAQVKAHSSKSMKTGKQIKERGFKKAFVTIKAGQKIKLFNS